METNYTSNIIYNDESLNDYSIEVEKTLDFLASILSNTIGPYGSTTIIQDRLGSHVITKDGYTVLKQIRFKQDLPRTITEIVMNISKNLVRTVGDGSTSSVVLSSILYKELSQLLVKYKLSPKTLVDLLNASIPLFRDMIQNNAKKIDNNSQELLNVAYIATNNDENVANLIYEIYNKIGNYGFISLEPDSRNDYYEISSGMEVPRGYTNFLFVNQLEQNLCKFEDPYIFMTNGSLTKSDLDFIVELTGQVCFSLKKPLVFIAKSYDSYVKTFFHENKVNNKSLELCAIDIALEDEKSYNRFNDLALFLGATPLDTLNNEKLPISNGTEIFKFIERLGKCKSSVISVSSSKFIEGYGNQEKIEEHVKFLEEILNSMIDKNILYDDKIYDYKKRIASLSKSTAIIHVGGNTETERNTRTYLYEDAIYACESALNYGVNVGGNLILAKLLKESDTFIKIKEQLIYIVNQYNDSEEILDKYLYAIQNAVRKMFMIILCNANIEENDARGITNKCIMEPIIYNLREGNYDTENETKIINSCETDIEIIKASFSIIGLLVTSNQFLSINFVENVI